MFLRRIWRSLFGQVKKTAQNYNVIERAEKSLGADKRAASPRHPGTYVTIKTPEKPISEMKAENEEKSHELLERLKSVRVSSFDSPPEYSEGSSRPLPQKRNAIPVPHYGYEEPTIIPEGKCSLRQALEFIGSYQNDPTNKQIQEISERYKLEPMDVTNITEHFRAFVLYVKKGEKSAATGVYSSNVPDVLGVYRTIVTKLQHNVGTDSLSETKQQEKDIDSLSQTKQQEKNIDK